MKKEWNIINKKGAENVEGIIESVLKSRNIKDVNHFLNPVFDDLLPIEDLSNITKALDIIIRGIEDEKRFSIFYDSDTDGISAGTIIYNYLLNFIPEVGQVYNIGKSHGLQDIDLDKIIESTDILIIVDSSSNDHKEQNYLKEHGVEVVIADHHEALDNPNVCIINSQFNGYENPQLSGAGVTWKLALALDEELGTEYAWDYIDLASVGILADVCEVGEEYPENRYIVKTGLENLKNVALSVIIDKYEFNSTSVLYSIAPLINSAVRTGNNKVVIDFISEKDKKKCKNLYAELKKFKELQDEQVAEAVSNVEFQIKNQDYINNKMTYAFVEEGDYAGLIATKIAEKYSKPCIILHAPKQDDKLYKGSMRGIGVKSFKDILESTGLTTYVIGHPNASGIGLFPEKLEPLIQQVNKQLRNVEFKTTLDVDIELKPEDITFELAEYLSRMNKISGKGFQPINICINDCEPSKVVVMQGKHTKFYTKNIEMIKWNDKDLGSKLISPDDSIYITIDVIGTLNISKFAGRTTLQFIISDYKEPQENLSFLR